MQVDCPRESHSPGHPVTVAAVAVWAWGRWESPTQWAYRICAECADLTPYEVDWLIETQRDSTLNREQSLALCRQHSVGGPDDARECEPCTLAVIEAAGK